MLLDTKLPLLKALTTWLLFLCFGGFYRSSPRSFSNQTATSKQFELLATLKPIHPLILSPIQIEELELSKIKATDLLKAHDGDAEKALKSFIAPAA